MKKIKKKLTKYNQDLMESLKDPEEACAYLKAALEESDMPEVFLLALRQVAEAHGMSQIAQATHLNRESLYKMLSKQGNPVLASLASILKTIGLKLSVEMLVNRRAA
ncbi:MAG: putative addiction module antidote protein [Deltaproteobacteria bacterium]|nr:putative addiction module antidote protein [Deltaproteobacteria bacterium]